MLNLKNMTIDQLNDYIEELSRIIKNIKIKQEEVLLQYEKSLTKYIVNNLDAIKRNPLTLLRYGQYALMDDEALTTDSYTFERIEKTTHPEVRGNCYRIFGEDGECLAVLSEHFLCQDWMGAGIGFIPYNELLKLNKEATNED